MRPHTKRLLEELSTYGIDSTILAQSTGIAKSTCFRIFKGETFPNPENLSKIINRYPRVCLHYIITGK